jgi:hypothetical protein
VRDGDPLDSARRDSEEGLEITLIGRRLLKPATQRPDAA